MHLYTNKGLPKRYYLASFFLHLLLVSLLVLVTKKTVPEKNIVTILLTNHSIGVSYTEKTPVTPVHSKAETKTFGESHTLKKIGSVGSSKSEQKEEENTVKKDLSDALTFGVDTESVSMGDRQQGSPEGSVTVVGHLETGTSKGFVKTKENYDTFGGRTGEGGDSSGGGEKGLGIGVMHEGLYLRGNFEHIRELIMRNLKYPHIARLKGYEGEVIVSFLITEKGVPEDIRVLSNSGHEILAKNVVETIRSIHHFPSPPVKVRVILPVAFKLK